MRCPTLKELPLHPQGKTGWPWTEESSQLPNTMPDGSSWPGISVVTPSLNQGQFIEETIRSVLLQGYPNLEYIIIDGGSKDGSVEIIRKYERWLSYWVSEPDRGQSHAINKGFKKASGELAAWLNSDDLYLPKAFKYGAEILMKYPAAGMIYGGMDFIDGNGKFLKKFNSEQFDLIRQLYTNMVPQPATFFRSEIFKTVGFLDETFHYRFDNDFFIRIGTKHVVKYEPVKIANYRLHQKSKTVSASILFFLEYLAILNKYFLNNRVPGYLHGHRRKILAYWHERTAHKYMDLHSYKNARDHLRKAIFLTPLRIQNITLCIYIIDTFFRSNIGRFIQSLSEKVRKN